MDLIEPYHHAQEFEDKDPDVNWLYMAQSQCIFHWYWEHALHALGHVICDVIGLFLSDKKERAMITWNHELGSYL